MSAKCINQWVKLGPTGFPVPGEQMGFRAGVNPCDSICQWALLKTTPYIAPPGYTECKHPDGIQYYYRLDRSGKVVPNSLIETLKYPLPASDNSGCWKIWKKFCPNT